MSTLSGIGNRNYVSGLVSGMDTEEMVEKMLSGTQAKIDKQTGLQQQLEWKQEIYRLSQLRWDRRRNGREV